MSTSSSTCRKSAATTACWPTSGCSNRRSGSAFRPIAGYGRHGRLHEEHFFELAGDLPVEVGFALTEEEAQRLLAHLAGEKLRLFYIKLPLEMGMVGDGV